MFQLGIEGGLPLIAKFYRPARWSYDQILEEHAFCAELTAAEWPVVPPLIGPNGQSAHRDGEFVFALFTRFGGHAPELDKLDTIELLGRSLGRLHAVGALSPFQHRPAINMEDYGVASREFLLSSDSIPTNLREAYDTLTRDILKIVEVRFRDCRYAAIRLHADCHRGNILWRDDRAVFVDFDDRELSLVESLRTLRMMHYAAWIARRWSDPAFPPAFSWFNTERYWAEHILSLREQFAILQEEPLSRPRGNF